MKKFIFFNRLNDLALLNMLHVTRCIVLPKSFHHAVEPRLTLPSAKTTCCRFYMTRKIAKIWNKDKKKHQCITWRSSNSVRKDTNAPGNFSLSGWLASGPANSPALSAHCLSQIEYKLTVHTPRVSLTHRPPLPELVPLITHHFYLLNAMNVWGRVGAVVWEQCYHSHNRHPLVSVRPNSSRSAGSRFEWREREDFGSSMSFWVSK